MKNNAPYFNSPSMPSFRMFDDEDDLGKYVEDPKLRHPVGPVSGTACTSDDNLQREARVLPSKATTTHQNVQLNVSFVFSRFFCLKSICWCSVIDYLIEQKKSFL